MPIPGFVLLEFVTSLNGITTSGMTCVSRQLSLTSQLGISISAAGYMVSLAEEANVASVNASPPPPVAPGRNQW